MQIICKQRTVQSMVELTIQWNRTIYRKHFLKSPSLWLKIPSNFQPYKNDTNFKIQFISNIRILRLYDHRCCPIFTESCPRLYLSVCVYVCLFVICSMVFFRCGLYWPDLTWPDQTRPGPTQVGPNPTQHNPSQSLPYPTQPKSDPTRPYLIQVGPDRTQFRPDLAEPESDKVGPNPNHPESELTIPDLTQVGPNQTKPKSEPTELNLSWTQLYPSLTLPNST